MDKISLDKDIKVFCVTATSFPMGVLAAHQQLHTLLPDTEGRRFFGISYGNPQGGITYKAAAEEMVSGEAEIYNYETFLIKKGKYLSKTLTDYQKDTSAIGSTFQEMLQHPELDKNGYCVEIYLSNKEVQCLVKLQ